MTRSDLVVCGVEHHGSTKSIAGVYLYIGERHWHRRVPQVTCFGFYGRARALLAGSSPNAIHSIAIRPTAH